jgi:hypothetical protein
LIQSVHALFGAFQTAVENAPLFGQTGVKLSGGVAEFFA